MHIEDEKIINADSLYRYKQTLNAIGKLAQGLIGEMKQPGSLDDDPMLHVHMLRASRRRLARLREEIPSQYQHLCEEDTNFPIETYWETSLREGAL